MKKTNYYKEYDINLSHLSPWEIELVSELKQVVKICGDIYKKQKNVDLEGGNFYDSSLSKEIIQKASKNDPKILNPYYVVKKSSDGNPLAVSYYQEYKEELDQMILHLKKASSIHKDDDYKNYLDQFIKDIINSDYSESEKLWLQLNGSKVDIRLGPIETYNDKLFGVKRAFQANLRVLNEKEQSNVSEYVKAIVELQPSSPFSVENPEKNLKIRVDNIIAIGGWHADLIPRGSNYPDDVDLSDYGVKVLIYDNTTREVNERLYNLAGEVLSKEDFSQIDKEVFLANSTRYILFHEIAESIVKLKYPDFVDRLKSMNDIVREIFSDLIGVKSSAIQVLKGVLKNEDYRDLLLIFILEGIWQWYKYERKGRAVGTYATGFVMATDYLLTNEAIKVNDDGKISIDYPSLYSQIDSLTTISLGLMKDHGEAEAKDIFDKYSNSDFLQKYSKFIKE